MRDDVNAAILKEKEMKISYADYGDDDKKEVDLNICTNPIMMSNIGWVMLDPL